jgi:hypothetical protein
VYANCLGSPRPLGSTDLPGWPEAGDRSPPISHYVGFTQQEWPMNRAGGHAGAGMGTVVLLIVGTDADEERLKSRGRCPRCGKSLNYRREATAWVRAARSAARTATAAST